MRRTPVPPNAKRSHGRRGDFLAHLNLELAREVDGGKSPSRILLGGQRALHLHECLLSPMPRPAVAPTDGKGKKRTKKRAQNTQQKREREGGGERERESAGAGYESSSG